MFKLLNRFAWVLSLSFGFIIAFLIIGLNNNYRISSDDIFFSGIFGLIAGLIIKKFLFSKSFIQNRLEFFANSIKENYFGEKIEKTQDYQNKKSEEIVNLEETKEQIKINEKIEKEEFEKIETEKTIDLENSKKYTSYSSEPSAFEKFIGKVGDYIKDFFSTNLLAKLGSILVFLAVVYLLKDMFFSLGPVAKLSMGIVIGFLVYFAGVKIYFKYKNEGLILMGIGILINFAVILSGRYLIGNNGYLSETMTFVFLILNTIFGVLTSLIYKSKTLLIFSFIFAYLNPFIIGAKSNGEPYTLIGYSLIVSLGALFIARKEANLTLVILSFVLGNILFLVAPFSDSIGWSSKIILTSVLSIITIFLITKFKGLKVSVNKQILGFFSGTYLFIILNLLNSTTIHTGMLQVMGNALSSNLGFFVYNLVLLGLFVFSIKVIFLNSEIKSNNNGNNILNIFLFVPLIILIGILFSGNLIFGPFILIGTILVYLIAFSVLNISGILAYIFFSVLGIFTFFFNIKIGTQNLEFIEFITIIGASLIFLFSSYYYSKKENLEKLFPIGTIGTIALLAPIIQNSGKYMFFSVLVITIFALANLILPLVNSKLLKKESLVSLITGTITGALFFAFEIYNFGEIHFSGITEGFAFLALAIVYFIEGYFIANKLGFENMKKDIELQNTFYSFIGVSVSLFSVAIAFVFANHPEIISTTWLFEATILYFFYSKNANKKIFAGATILFVIGLVKFGILLDVVRAKEYLFLVSFSVILASFILNLYFINKAKENIKIHNIHHILHIIGIGIMGGLLLKIIPSTGHGWSMLGISIFITILGYFYAKFDFKFLKIVFLFVIGTFGILHIGELNMIFWKLQRDELEYLKIMQYLVSAIVIINLIIWKKLNLEKNINKILLIIISIYAFIISNLYILDLFENIFGDFTLTIYWGLIASALLFYGIQKDIIKYRTIGLYFLTLTTIKIFLSDVWQISDTNSRVIVFAILGVIFIIISTLYTKKYGDNLLGEFSLKNLKDDKQDKYKNLLKKVEKLNL